MATTSALSGSAAVAGVLRSSKGAWLFRPSSVDVLWRVTPMPAPSPDALATSMHAHLVVTATSVQRAATGNEAPRATPRTGVPAHLVGPVVSVADVALVVDVGVPIVVEAPTGAWAAGTWAAGDVVAVDVDVDVGVRCVVQTRA